MLRQAEDGDLDVTRRGRPRLDGTPGDWEAPAAGVAHVHNELIHQVRDRGGSLEGQVLRLEVLEAEGPIDDIRDIRCGAVYRDRDHRGQAVLGRRHADPPVLHHGAYGERRP
jgi:hypothetical protein